jgi:hypothetical protein
MDYELETPSPWRGVESVLNRVLYQRLERERWY